MSISEITSIATLITSTITMFILIVAVLPDFKQGLLLLRDAVLWAALVLALAAFVWLGWQQFRPSSNAAEPIGDSTSVPDVQSLGQVRP